MLIMLSTLGALLIISMSLAVYLALFTRNKSRVLLDERNKVMHLLNNLPGMAYQSYHQANWPMILASEGCEELTGWSKTAFESGSVLWGKLIHPDDYMYVCETVKQAIKNNTRCELE